MRLPDMTANRPLKLALIASVALNLLFVGAGVTRYFVAVGPERLTMSSQMQLFPRRFFSELDRSRRTELLRVFRSYDPAFRDGRAAVREQIAALAAVLAAEPYDPAQMKAAVEGFTAKTDSLAATGGDAALTLIAQLKPEERKLLAKNLTLREEHGRGQRDPKPAAQ